MVRIRSVQVLWWLMLGCVVLAMACGERKRRDRPLIIEDDAGHVDAGDVGGDEGNCGGGERYCDEECVVVDEDPRHCGACEEACEVGKVCMNGRCTQPAGPCPGVACVGFTYCDEDSGDCLPGCADAGACTGGRVCDEESHQCVCAEGEHVCGGQCVASDDVATCGGRCEPCPTSENGAASCVDGQCVLECDEGHRMCGGECAPCPSDAESTVCEGTQCVPNACDEGMRLCDGACVSCPDAPQTRCEAGACVASDCPEGMELCDGSCALCPTEHVTQTTCEGGACVAAACEAPDGALTEICEGACAVCPAGTATAACDGTRCVPVDCEEGFHVCGEECVADDSIDQCGPSCEACATDPLGTASCQEGACVLECNADARPCASGCCDWTKQSVDGGNRMSRNSLALDASGAPHLVYRDNYANTIKYARWTGSSWSREVVDNVGAGLDWALRPALIVDGNGTPFVVYPSGGGPLYMAYRTAQGWEKILLDDAIGAGGNPTLFLDHRGWLHMTYLKEVGSAGQLIYVMYDGTNWTAEVVEADIGRYPTETSILVDGSGVVHLSYRSTPANGLRYAQRSAGGAWSHETIATGNGTGVGNCIALDGQGRPVIGYGVQYPGELHLAVRQSNGWSDELVQAGPRVVDCGLGIDGAGKRHVVYFDNDAWQILYSTDLSGQWSHHHLTTGGGASGPTQLVLDGAAEPVLSYHKGDSVMVAR